MNDTMKGDLGQSGKMAEAIKAFDEALKINPQNALVQDNKKLALKTIGHNK